MPPKPKNTAKHIQSITKSISQKQKASPKEPQESEQLPQWISVLSAGIRLQVRAKPGAKTSQIMDTHTNAIGIQLAAPPRDGEANTELISHLSQTLGIHKQHITLTSGHKSRDKTVVIDADGAGISTNDIVKRILSDT